MKKPQIITMMDKSAAKINIIRLSPKPSPLIISACSALIVNVVLSPADKSPTSLPTDEMCIRDSIHGSFGGNYSHHASGSYQIQGFRDKIIMNLSLIHI